MLSTRAAKWANIGFAHGDPNAYDPVHNPNGIVSFANAENWLVQEDLAHYISSHKFDSSCFGYGEGSTGTVRLRTAMAKHLNAHFKPVHEIDSEQITFAAGVTALNEACAQITCNPESKESIMLGMPVYGSFSKDLVMRTGVTPEYVHVGDTNQFSPDCVAAYEAGFEAAKARGVNIRALIICNPHNPLGQCYPRETLIGLMRLCASKGIHIISDEVYALSVYHRDDRPSEKFTSVRSIDPAGIIDPGMVHVLYGMSKDFGSGGMHLGCLISQNDEFIKAARSICRFGPPSQFSMDLATKILEDRTFVTRFLEKSRGLMLKSRLLTENLLTQASISFHQEGNAGLFIWIDLTPHLPLGESNGDGWAAERLLSKRFGEAGVIMGTSEAYHAPSPGRFRVVTCLKEDALKEGIRRILRVLNSQNIKG